MRRGEKGTPVVFTKELPRRGGAAADGPISGQFKGAAAEATQSSTYLMAKTSTVFNAAQVEGDTPPERPQPPGLAVRLESAERFVAAAGAVIEHDGNRAESYALNPFTQGFKRDDDPITDYVIVSTIHSAKGLEPDVVYVPALQVGHYSPTYTKSEDDYEEERRCLYVALTRAKPELNLSKALLASYQRIAKGSASFLKDMPGRLVNLEVQHGKSAKAPSGSLEIDANAYRVEF